MSHRQNLKPQKVNNQLSILNGYMIVHLYGAKETSVSEMLHTQEVMSGLSVMSKQFTGQRGSQTLKQE